LIQSLNHFNPSPSEHSIFIAPVEEERDILAMKGLWDWPSDEKERQKVLNKIAREELLSAILKLLYANESGLSNAEIDGRIMSNSQWRTLTHIEELMALGLIEYRTSLFGEPGRYSLTLRGKEVAATLSA
jgi:hypothetical protein